MSHFVFGAFDFNAEMLMDSNDLIWSLSGEALRQKLHLQMGCNIVQTVVKEMAKKQLKNSDRLTCFLLTGSPLEDTSDSLVSPCAYGADFSEHIENAILRIQDWLTVAFASDGIDEIHLFFTEGFDNSFQDIGCPLNQFSSVLTKMICDEGSVPSLHLCLSR